MNRILLIGNAPTVLDRALGDKIDAFGGLIARFNHFKTAGYEPHVGSRTDIWITCQNGTAHDRKSFDRILFMSVRPDDVLDKLTPIQKNAERIPYDNWMETRKKMDYGYPSSGAATVNFLLKEKAELWIYGFNYLKDFHRHHYCDDQRRGNAHNHEKEKAYFEKLISEGKIHPFEFDSEKSGMPAVRTPIPCGVDTNILGGREPCQGGWYSFIGKKSAGKSVLDVGAGSSEGLKILTKETGMPAVGFDVDRRLLHINPELIVSESLSGAGFKNKSFDVVSSVEVIEHVIEDRVLLNEMRRIARRFVYVTTPNWNRSHAQNHMHCREYTIGEFVNVFLPDEVYVGAPDGKSHITKLLEKLSTKNYLDYSPQGPENKKKEPPTTLRLPITPKTKFNSTVDGEEWACFCAIFKI